MAINLTAVFRMRDQGSSRMRRLTQLMERMNRTSRTTSDSMSRAQSATNRFGGAVSSASNRMGGFATRVTSLRVGADGVSASLRGMQSSLVGIAGAYLGAQGAAKAFSATIGAAANFEQSEVAVKAIFNDDKASSKYLKLIQKKAIDSPLLNSTEMLSSSKTLVAMTKNVDELGKAWSIIERLMVLDPTQGTDGAAFALKEMWQGDALSMVERFGLDKKKLNEIKKMDIPKQISEINKMLDGMGITQKTVDAMGDTTKGLFAQLGEKSRTFFKDIGMESNSKLADFLRRLNKMFDGLDTKSISDKLGSMLGKATDKAIALFNIFVKWRTEIAYVAGAIGTFVAALAVIGTISALSNPIALIAMGISAAAVGFKALYDNSETFRGIIDGIIGKVKRLATAFNFGGTSGLINALFPPDIAKQVNSVVDGIKSKMAELTEAFKTGGIGGVFDKIFGEGSFETIKTKFEEFRAYATEKFSQLKGVFGRLKETFSQAFSTIADIISNVWTIIEPYLSGFWNILQVIGDIAMIVFNNVIAPAISFLVQLFSTLWAIAKPILTALGIAWEALSTIIKWAWDNVLSPLVDFILTGVKNAFDAFSDALSVVQGWFETLSGWVSTAYGHVKDFIGFISSAKLPSWISNGISAGVNFVGNLMGAGDSKKGGKKSHYSGLDSVPYDGYSARLHKGERIMTARENKEYSRGNGGSGNSISIAKLADQIIVREDADINRITDAIVTKILERRGVTV